MGAGVPRRANKVGKSRNPSTSKSNDTGNLVSRGKDPSQDYLCCLMDPERCIARIPDAEPRKTAVIRSIRNLEIPILQDNYNQGRFSFALQPILGNIGDPTTFQLAVANGAAIASNTSTWDQVDWSDIAYYLSTQSGSDVRTDINVGPLTSGTSSFQFTSFSGAGNDLTSKVLVSGNPTYQNQAVDNTPPNILFASPSPNDKNAPGVNGGVIILPFGDWNISIAAKFAVSVIPASGFDAINFQTTNMGGVNRVSIQQEATNVGATATTLLCAATAQVASAPGANTLSFCIAPVQGGTNGANADPTVSVSATYVTITPSNFASSSNYLDGGVMEEVRPVAMSVLATYMGSTLNNGGEISICYVPYKDLKNNYFQRNTGGRGQLQMYENVAQLDGAYDGRLSDGAYCTWAPYDPTDWKFVSPTEMNNSEYPAIVCSGRFNPDQATNTFGAPLRLRVCVVYEFVTKSTLFETIPVFGSTSMIDQALVTIKRFPFGKANKEHQSFIRRVLGFYNQNRGWINPLVSGVASLAL